MFSHASDDLQVQFARAALTAFPAFQSRLGDEKLRRKYASAQAKAFTNCTQFIRRHGLTLFQRGRAYQMIKAVSSCFNQEFPHGSSKERFEEIEDQLAFGPGKLR
jgi:hypothetical protein